MKQTVSDDNAKNSGENESQRETQPHRIRQLLTRLREQRSLLSVHFRGRTQPYGSLLLEVDTDANELELDELTPVDGDRLIRLHPQFVVQGQLEGAQISFPVEVLRREVRDDMASYRAKLPEVVHYYQRRKAFRVDVPVRPLCKISLITDEGDCLEGRLADISVTGAGFQLKNKQATTVPRGTRCECEVELPSTTIQTTVEIRFNQPVKDKPHSRLGAQFTGLLGADRRKIERYVFDLQRRQLKAER